MATMTVHPGGAAGTRGTTSSTPAHRLARVAGAVRLAVLCVVGMAPADELAEADVAAPGHPGGLRHV